MSTWVGFLLAGSALASPLFAAEALPVKPAPQVPEKVEIGMPASLFQGVPAFLVNQLSTPFKQFMKTQTGIAGDVQQLPDAMTAADHLNSGKIHLAVFQGHEFAWAKSKYEDLIPLAVVVPNQPPTQAFLVVRWDCDANNLGGLADKILTLPPGTKDHSKLFLAQQRTEYLAKTAFSAQLTADSVKDALYDVIDKKAQVTCVDALGLEHFRTTYPGQYKNLKILSQSAVFPQACVAVKKGQMDEASIRKFQVALLRASELSDGQKMMTLWKLQKFENVPANYDQQLKDCFKSYPTPIAVQPAKNK